MKVLRVVTAGSVDDGKSTLIGRLLYDARYLHQDQVEDLTRPTGEPGAEHLDLALVTDGLKAEAEKRITIDVAYRYLTGPEGARIIIADTPGHELLTRNMVTGASTADLALLLIDASRGLLTQTRRHALLALLLGVPHILLCVNKMDLVDYSRSRFEELVAQFTAFVNPWVGAAAQGASGAPLAGGPGRGDSGAARPGLPGPAPGAPQIHAIPICALSGENVVHAGPHLEWYDHPPLLTHLEELSRRSGSPQTAAPAAAPLRLPIQLVLGRGGGPGGGLGALAGRDTLGARHGGGGPQGALVDGGDRPETDAPSGYAGRIASGTIRKGQAVTVLPSGGLARVCALFRGDKEVAEAKAGESILVSLEPAGPPDLPGGDDTSAPGPMRLDPFRRGDMIVSSDGRAEVSTEVEATLLWLEESRSLLPTQEYILQHTTNRTVAWLSEVEEKLDVDNIAPSRAEPDGGQGDFGEGPPGPRPAELTGESPSPAGLEANEIARVVLRTARPLCFDPYSRNRATGGFILIDPRDNRTVAAGMILAVPSPSPHSPPQAQAASRPGPNAPLHRAWRRCVWLTGLPGAGKTTIAREAAKRLEAEGIPVYRIDGDTLRQAVSRDLGFSPEDRTENIRRAAVLARHLYEADHTVLCSLISPYEADRDQVRALFPPGDFVEVYVQVSLEEAERRDPKGLYRRARAGEITNFTGIHAPYQEPPRPDLVLDTQSDDLATCVDKLIHHLATLPSRPGRAD